MNIGNFFAPDMAWLRRSKFRVPILRWLLVQDNRLRSWITYFSFEKGLHPKHRITQYHKFFLDHIQPQDTVLDLGCGLGLLAADMAKQAKKVVGIDIDEPSLRVAKKQQAVRQQAGKVHPLANAPGVTNLEFILGDATTYDFQEHFSVIVLSNVLEHIQDRISFLKKIKPLADRFLIRVPMIDREWIVLLKYELGVEHRLDPTHFTEFTEEQFRYETAKAGLKIVELNVRFGEIYAVLE